MIMKKKQAKNTWEMQEGLHSLSGVWLQRTPFLSLWLQAHGLTLQWVIFMSSYICKCYSDGVNLDSTWRQYLEYLFTAIGQGSGREAGIPWTGWSYCAQEEFLLCLGDTSALRVMSSNWWRQVHLDYPEPSPLVQVNWWEILIIFEESHHNKT